MQRRHAPLLFLLLLTFLSPATGRGETVRSVGSLVVRVDDTLAYPGGLFVVDLSARRGVRGNVVAVLDGRRCPLYPSSRGLRGLVPIPPTLPPGSYTLGVEARGGRYRRRIPLAVAVAPRDYPGRDVVIPEVKRALLELPRSRARRPPGAALPAHRDLLPLLARPLPVAGSRAARLQLRRPHALRGQGGRTGGGDDGRGLGRVPPRHRLRGRAGHGGAGAGGAAGAVGGDTCRSPARPWCSTTARAWSSLFFHLGRVDVREGDVVEGRWPVGRLGRQRHRRRAARPLGRVRPRRRRGPDG